MKERTDEYKILWIVEGHIRETIFNTKPVPKVVAYAHKHKIKKSTHKLGTLVVFHKDDNVANIVVAVNKRQLPIEFPFKLT